MARIGDPKGPDALTTVAFVTLIVLAGGNAVGIKIVGGELDAFWAAGLRFSACSTDSCSRSAS